MRAFEKWLFDEIYSILWPVVQKGAFRSGGGLKFAGELRENTKNMVAKMGRAGWFLEGQDLRDMLKRAVLSPLQRFRDGEIEDIRAYMEDTFKYFLEWEADRLSETAKLAGTHINQLMGEIEGRQNMTAIVAAFQNEAAEQREYRELKRRAKAEEDKKQLKMFT